MIQTEPKQKEFSIICCQTERSKGYASFHSVFKNIVKYRVSALFVVVFGNDLDLCSSLILNLSTTETFLI